MKRFTKILISSVLFSFVLMSVNMFGAVKAYAPVDQANVNGLTGYWLIKTHEWVGQSFKPSKNRIDAIAIKASGNGAPGVLSINVVDYATPEIVSIGVSNAIVESSEGWIYFTFAEDLVVTHPNATHIMWISTASNTAYWSVDPTGTYANGNAYIDSISDSGDDFGFVTYGYDYVAEEEPPGGGEEPADTGDAVGEPSTTADGDEVETPASDETSSDIKAPAKLKADVKDDGKSVDLTWEKSDTEEIDGYKIFRSLDKDTDKDYIKVAETKIDELEYTDKKIELDKTYYYVVRAYKDKDESESSNMVEVTPEKQTNAEASFWQKLFDQYLWYTVSVSLLILFGLAWLLYYLIKKRKKAKSIVDPQKTS
ncbi:hypothetical protein ACFL14_00445 [Patescibacteria group bacterium]